ncbi:putative selenate ABC transporter substrate-binding protein [Nocardioides sp. zg-DK7169]|uniref:putative selenate ABC transporter substrate-binding protein n=1 Tax=Nocardioides sp. zg-DK7169 TaxID=2736600 RepID=UPI001554045D|nr:putative selenate ABC transporter substrate-binding protein [Nocardioides sp. zg-DK7169]NPC95302.1 putative selenate ABC transporter substrate-binding protein [Nocardioides sp. zg-DK7169]
MSHLPARAVIALVPVLALLAGCGADDSSAGGDNATLRISAIPDQDPAELTAREEALAEYLSSALDVEVEYVPVTDYAASVSLFRAGDLDTVFYGGLTGVQARLQTPGATLLAQRDIDAEFRSVFIANADTGIEPFDDVAGLTAFEDTRFTFGSESSTSGRLMPEYFLREAGVDSGSELSGRPGYSGSHDATIDLVEAGSYEGGALNVQVWEARTAAGTVDTDKVVEVFTTPPYSDYHWLGGPDLEDRFGAGFTEELRTALLELDGSTPEEQAVLERYGAGKLIPTDADSYERIEEIGRTLGLVS